MMASSNRKTRNSICEMRVNTRGPSWVLGASGADDSLDGDSAMTAMFTVPQSSETVNQSCANLQRTLIFAGYLPETAVVGSDLRSISIKSRAAPSRPTTAAAAGSYTKRSNFQPSCVRAMVSVARASALPIR